MEYRTLGKTGLEVSVLSFGASSLGSVFRDLLIRQFALSFSPYPTQPVVLLWLFFPPHLSYLIYSHPSHPRITNGLSHSFSPPHHHHLLILLAAHLPVQPGLTEQV